MRHFFREPSLPRADKSAGEKIKQRLYTRVLPESYRPLIQEARFMLERIFSDKLEQAVSTKPIFTRDAWGRKEEPLRDHLSREAVAPNHLTEFGQQLQMAVQGKTFIDLGCEDPSAAVLPRFLASAFGANTYIGVDKELEEEKEETDGNMAVIYLEDDMLTFLARIGNLSGICFCLSGLEPVESKDVSTQKYIDACLQEMASLTKPGDAILIGQGTHGFAPEKYGFQKIATHGHHHLFVK